MNVVDREHMQRNRFRVFPCPIFGFRPSMPAPESPGPIIGTPPMTVKYFAAQSIRRQLDPRSPTLPPGAALDQAVCWRGGRDAALNRISGSNHAFTPVHLQQVHRPAERVRGPRRNQAGEASPESRLRNRSTPATLGAESAIGSARQFKNTGASSRAVEAVLLFPGSRVKGLLEDSIGTYADNGDPLRDDLIPPVADQPRL
jgi:hypothetical protein